MTDHVDGTGARRGLARLLERSRSEPPLRREADMMGLTVCIVLLAALTAGNDHSPHSRLDVLAIVWGATFGIALTHWFAVTLSVRLVRDPTLTYSPLEMLVAELSIVVVVAAAATVVVLATSEQFDRLSARVTAAVFLAGLVGLESRAGGASLRRSWAYAVGALLIGVTIATVKWFVGR